MNEGGKAAFERGSDETNKYLGTGADGMMIAGRETKVQGTSSQLLLQGAALQEAAWMGT